MVTTVVLHAFFFAFVHLEGSVQRIITDHRLIFERFTRSKKFLILMMIVLPTDLFSIHFGFLSCFRSAATFLFSFILLMSYIFC